MRNNDNCSPASVAAACPGDATLGRASVLPTAVPPERVPDLVAQVYAEAPAALRTRLLEQLMAPLGFLSLVAVADGLFARMALRPGWSRLHIPTEEASQVPAEALIALVQRVQQVSTSALQALCKTIAASPVLASSAAAAMLVAVLAREAMLRSAEGDHDFDPPADGA